jgi:hypothetical protein
MIIKRQSASGTVRGADRSRSLRASVRPVRTVAVAIETGETTGPRKEQASAGAGGRHEAAGRGLPITGAAQAQRRAPGRPAQR